MGNVGSLGVFIKTYFSKVPVEGLGSEFVQVLNQESETLNPQEWDYSEYKRYIPSDIIVTQSLLYNCQSLKLVHKYLIQYAHQQMDNLAKNPPPLPYIKPIHIIDIEIEGRKLEMDFALKECKRLWVLSKQIEHVLEEIKLNGALGVLFYPQKPTELEIIR